MTHLKMNKRQKIFLKYFGRRYFYSREQRINIKSQKVFMNGNLENNIKKKSI